VRQHPIRTVVAVLGFLLAARAEAAGKYLNDLLLKDVGDGRQFELLNDYAYQDSKDTVWTVPKGEKVNGASIPSYLWSIAGGPWEGLYRNASVIHDYFFRTKQYDSDSVHWVFYDAMLTSGVNPTKAKIMYFAVLRFNPRWKAITLSKKPCPTSPPGHAQYRCEPVLADDVGERVVYLLETPKFDQKELDDTAALIQKQDPSLDQIERLAKARRETAKK